MEYSKTKNKKTPQLKEKLDSWLDNNVNQPLASKGYGNIGAGLSAAGSAAGDMFIPEDATDVAMSFLPFGKIAKGVGKIFKGAKKGKKAAKMAEDTAEAFEPEQTLSKFKQLQQPTKADKAGLIGDMNPVKKRKDIRGEKKAIKDSKTREAHGNLKEKKIEEEWERKARLGENPSSPVLDYSKMK